jgi:hypothetical protein
VALRAHGVGQSVGDPCGGGVRYAGLGVFYLATAEALHALGYLTRYAAPALVIGEREALKADAVTAIARAGD